jgi:hypothetical protein
MRLHLTLEKYQRKLNNIDKEVAPEHRESTKRLLEKNIKWIKEELKNAI